MLPTLARLLRTEATKLASMDIHTARQVMPPGVSRFEPVFEKTPRRVKRSLPAVLMRAGTSKGLFVHRRHLPSTEKAWTGPLLAAMGSQHSDVRQIDGVGGATSTTSKVAVVSPSSRPGIDVDYTFVQVAVGKEAIDLSGNCGNMCAGVGPFALQEGLVQARPGQDKVQFCRKIPPFYHAYDLSRSTSASSTQILPASLFPPSKSTRTAPSTNTAPTPFPA